MGTHSESNIDLIKAKLAALGVIGKGEVVDQLMGSVAGVRLGEGRGVVKTSN